MNRTLNSPKQVLDSPCVMDAISETAVDHMDKGRLCDIAKKTVATLERKAAETGEMPLDDELIDAAIHAVRTAEPCPHQCGRCEYHKSKANKTPGKLIPGHSGKCTHPVGLCSHVRHGEEATDGATLPAPAAAHVALDLAVMNEASTVEQAVMDAEEVYRDLGRLDATLFYATVAESMTVQIFEKVKKSKAYKKIPIRDEEGKVRPSHNFDEFCRAKFGRSYRRLQEISGNLALLGDELYESAERIGFRTKDYRALKALPPEEQAVVKAALASGSKDEVVDILQDMAARHQAEKEAAKKERDDLTADCEARGKLLQDKAEKLERSQEELFRLKSLSPDADLELRLAREEEAVDLLHRAQVTFISGSKGFLEGVAAILADEAVSAHTKEHAVWEVRLVCNRLNQFLVDHGIPVDFSEIVAPEWMRGAAQADLEAGKTEEPNGSGAYRN